MAAARLRLGPPAHLRGEPGAHRPARPGSRAALRSRPGGQHHPAGWLPEGQHPELAVQVTHNSQGAGAASPYPAPSSCLPSSPLRQLSTAAAHALTRGRPSRLRWLGAGADCGHRPPPPLSSRPWPFAAAGLRASKPEAGQAAKAREGSWAGRLAGSTLGWGQPRWLRVAEHPG